MRPSNETIRLGKTEAKLFANEDNEALLRYTVEHKMTTSDSLNTFALAAAADDPNNPLGLAYGHLKAYRGYHDVTAAADAKVAA